MLHRGFKKLIGGIAAVTVVASSLVLGGLGATPANAAPLSDNSEAIYGLRGPADTDLNGGVFRIDVTTQTVDVTPEVDGQRNNDRSSNALGISIDGTMVYSVDNGTRGSSSPQNAVQLRQFNTETDETRRFNVPSTFGTSSLRGAVSPINDIFYFSGSYTVYAFNPATDEIFAAGRLPQGSNSLNGDFAFSRNGTLYTFVGPHLYETPAHALPTTSSTADLPMNLIATIDEFTDLSTQGANGIAFGGNGHAFGTTTNPDGTYLIEYDIARRAAHPSVLISTGSDSNFVDLASRHFLNTLTLKLNLPDGRQVATDQFLLDIDGAGDLVGDDSTTTGSLVGVQNEYAGPVIAAQGGKYTVSTSGVGATDLAGYDTSVMCTDADGDNVPVAGASSAWDLVFPTIPGGTDVECVITATLAAPSIALTKTADTDTYEAGDTVTYTFDVTNIGRVALSNVEIVDPLPGLTELTFTNWPGAPNNDPNESGASLTLQAGQSAMATAQLVVTQAHVDAGSIDNLATATGNPPTGDPVTDSDDVTITSPAQPGLVSTKTADVTEFTEVGDVITYTLSATNTGNVTLTNVTFTDDLAGLSALNYTWPGAAGTLLPEQTVTATATYTIAQNDIDRGFVLNAATASGNTPPTPEDPDVPGDPVDTPPTEVTLEGPEHDPKISLEKTATLSADETTVTYTLVATNIGNVTLTGVTIDDPLEGLSAISFDWSEAVAEGTLEPGQYVTGTATYEVQQSDRNAGSIVNLANTAGTPPNLIDPQNPDGPGLPQDPVTDEDPASVDLDQVAAISLVKTGSFDDTEFTQVGDLVTYTFTITNTGNVVLDDVTVTDPMLADAGIAITIDDAAWPATIGTLKPTENVVGTASYPVTQADIDAGEVVNLATATSVSPIEDPDNPGDFIRPTDHDDVTVPLNVAPKLALAKTGEFTDGAAVGDTIEYGFTVTNVGNQTITNVIITDEMLADAGVTVTIDDSAWPAEVGVLTPGQVVNATALYTVTQADVDAGHVFNLASVTGTPPTTPGDPTPPPLPPVEDDVDLPVPGTPAIDLVKTSRLLGEAKAGDSVEFSFVATNTGDLTLTEVTIEDPLPGLSELVYDWSTASAPGTLAPGEHVVVTATYLLTQGDVDAGHVDNTAFTTGTPPNAYDPEDPDGPGTPREPVEDDDTVITPLDPASSISLSKEGVLDGAAADGETVTYTFVATNTGDTTLTGVTIDDPLTGLSELTFDWSDATAPGVLAPGETVTATAQYALTQADVDAGGVVNIADTVGTPPNAYDPEDPDGPGIPREPVTDDDPSFVPTPQEPAIQLVKTGELMGADPQIAGSLVEYTFVAVNIGNVTLSDVTITDPLTGLSAISYDWSEATAEGILAPGERVTATATYALTQDDVDAGHVDNLATATGIPPVDPSNPDEPREPVEDEDDVTVPVPPAPAVELVKTSDLVSEAQAGEDIVFTFTGTNTGNVTLTDVEILDPLPGLGALDFVWPGSASILAPGETVAATAVYTLTQADVDAGSVLNVATIHGTPPATYDPEDPDEPKPQDPVEDDDTVVTPLPPEPAIELVKTGEVTGRGFAGDTIEYVFVATNTGNVTLSDVVIDDPLPGLSALTYVWPGDAGVLAPGESVQATASYLLTEADVDAGSVKNTATVVGFPPAVEDPETGDPVESDPVTDEDTAIVLTGELAVTGGASPALLLAAGGGLLLIGAAVVLAARARRQIA